MEDTFHTSAKPFLPKPVNNQALLNFFLVTQYQLSSLYSYHQYRQVSA